MKLQMKYDLCNRFIQLCYVYQGIYYRKVCCYYSLFGDAAGSIRAAAT